MMRRRKGKSRLGNKLTKLVPTFLLGFFDQEKSAINNFADENFSSLMVALAVTFKATSKFVSESFYVDVNWKCNIWFVLWTLEKRCARKFKRKVFDILWNDADIRHIIVILCVNFLAEESIIRELTKCYCFWAFSNAFQHVAISDAT